MANAARAAGYEAETAATGKDLMRRLKDRADIDAIILDSELPYPPLPDTIASLRYDVHLGLLPLRIVYTPDLGPATTYYISDTNRRVEVGVPACAETVNIRAQDAAESADRRLSANRRGPRTAIAGHRAN